MPDEEPEMPVTETAMADTCKQSWGIGFVVVGAILVVLLVLLAGGAIPVGLGTSPGRYWVAGAAALGLLTGFTTGVSNEPASGKEFVKFVGAGLLVPILGGIGSLLARTQSVTEKLTYSGTYLVEKSTTTVTSPSAELAHPVEVMGSFFVAFALLAILGLIGGALLRDAKAIDVKAA